jgi:hypothetical protein
VRTRYRNAIREYRDIESDFTQMTLKMMIYRVNFRKAHKDILRQRNINALHIFLRQIHYIFKYMLFWITLHKFNIV